MYSSLPDVPGDTSVDVFTFDMSFQKSVFEMDALIFLYQPVFIV